MLLERERCMFQGELASEWEKRLRKEIELEEGIKVLETLSGQESISVHVETSKKASCAAPPTNLNEEDD